MHDQCCTYPMKRCPRLHCTCVTNQPVTSLYPKGISLQRYVEQLRRCLQLEASEQPHANASLGVVKLANEIVSPPVLSPCLYKYASHPLV